MSALKTVFPTADFYFQVKVENEIYAFKEVSGISSEFTTEEIAEDGENRFKHKVPTNVKYSNLELKRGLVPENSKFIKWINDTIQPGFFNKIKPKNVEVSLLNEEGAITMSWSFVRAWPVAWNFASLNSMNNEILVESISLSYNTFTSKIVE